MKKGEDDITIKEIYKKVIQLEARFDETDRRDLISIQKFNRWAQLIVTLLIVNILLHVLL